MRLFLVSAAVLCSFLPAIARAGQVTLLHEFNFTDGGAPIAGLSFDGERLYGVTSIGGGPSSPGNGTLFSMRTDGTDFEVLHEFDFEGGYAPESMLVVNGSKLYGTAPAGGEFGYGVVYSIDKDGTNYQRLHSFSRPDGRRPLGSLLRTEDRLYGTAIRSDGDDSHGVIYSLALDGTDYTVLHAFTGPPDGGSRPGWGRLIQIGSSLYGTTGIGGLDDAGTVFSIGLDGSDLRVLHDFGAATERVPLSGLVAIGSRLFGTTFLSDPVDAENHGVIFGIDADGSDYEVLRRFSGNDGSGPWGQLIALDGRLFGSTINSNSPGGGRLFSILPDGSDFQLHHSFAGAPQDGTGPHGELLPIGSTLFGTTIYGGEHDWGTVFSIVVPEPNTQTLFVLAAVSMLLWRFISKARKLQSKGV